MEEMSGAGKRFEDEFTSEACHSKVSLESHELASLALNLFKGSEAVLEAGCGDGRWNAFLSEHGIANTGIDWSETLCDIGRKKSPTSRFVSGDLNQMPFEDGEFDGLISLGAIEHVAIGPEKALQEFFRVLKSRGHALITVPNGSWLRKLRRIIPRVLSPKQRKLWNENIKRFGAARAYGPRFGVDSNKNPYFYEYEFNQRQFIGFIENAGFAVDDSFVFDHASGIYNSFWPLCGKTYTPRLNPFGRSLQKIIPCSGSGQMIGCVAHKPQINTPLSNP